MQQIAGGGGAARANGLKGAAPGALIRSLLEEVRPGDLITSDFMRRLLRGLAGLEEYLGELDEAAGIGKVPDVVFLQLPRAASILRENDPSLHIEGVYDPFGNRVSVIDEKNRGERIVLAQFPVPGAKITGDRSVKLLVSAETNRWMNVLELVADKGPGLVDYWQKRQRTTDTERVAGGNNPQQEAAPAPAASAAPGAAQAETASAKPATKARTRRKPAKPVEG